jgi:hypothetical protein
VGFEGLVYPTTTLWSLLNLVVVCDFALFIENMIPLFLSSPPVPRSPPPQSRYPPWLMLQGVLVQTSSFSLLAIWLILLPNWQLMGSPDVPRTAVGAENGAKGDAQQWCTWARAAIFLSEPLFPMNSTNMKPGNRQEALQGPHFVPTHRCILLLGLQAFLAGCMPDCGWASPSQSHLLQSIETSHLSTALIGACT